MNAIVQNKRSHFMRIKLPPHFLRYVIIMLVFFVIGFIIARLLAPAPDAVSGGGTYSLVKEAGQASSGESIAEKPEPSYIGIIIALVVISFIVTYGYYREKRKK